MFYQGIVSVAGQKPLQKYNVVQILFKSYTQQEADAAVKSWRGNAVNDYQGMEFLSIQHVSKSFVYNGGEFSYFVNIYALSKRDGVTLEQIERYFNRGIAPKKGEDYE